MTEEKEGSHQVTMLLVKWGEGQPDAQDELMPIVYEELRKMARRHMRKQSPGHTFRTTELIHEAYLKLVSNKKQSWENRFHFFGAAANAMRQILVDYARTKSRKKRGGSFVRVEFNETAVVSSDRSDEIICLHEALKQLEELDPRKSQVVELKFFGGLKVDEIAGFLEVSPMTVKRDWQFARSWLMKELTLR